MENLGIDVKLMIAQVVNFALFYFIFRKFIAGPMNSLAVDEKKKEEEKNKAFVALQNCDTQINKKEGEFKKKMDKEKEDFMKEVKLEAEEAKKEIISQAKEEAQEIINAARQEVSERKADFQKDLRGQVTDMSVLLINRALRGYLTDDMQKELTKRILSSLDKKSS